MSIKEEDENLQNRKKKKICIPSRRKTIRTAYEGIFKSKLAVPWLT